METIGIFHNPTDQPKELVVLPDGRIDLFFIRFDGGAWEVMLMGLETEAEQRTVRPQMLVYSVSFKPLAVEYILQTSIADILNSASPLTQDFWGFTDDDLKDFETFSKVATAKLVSFLPKKIDERKRKLFNLIYTFNGEMSVQELSGAVSWSTRQINRYFSQQLGLSLKAYCDILRFRASLAHIAHGKLFPELNFADQSHFIRAVKKFSGVPPKELSKNKNDRFVLLSVLKQR